ncbi:MAG: indole-3-glycerol phosphate synthase TrpC [Porphyromonadaceae bacterium]|nr:MAG: indole-3-glycerol phosphate synthase TrpC [Porphyromonadaceae bacterium]
MNILGKIAAHKRTEVSERKELYPIALLERRPFFNTEPVSLKKHLMRPGASGIIAEFKRQSPSKGIINANAKVEEVTVGYMNAGASALSILTDNQFFGGNNEDLIKARELNFCPILRKDFIVDPYQIIEAKSIGADAILLIAAILTPEETLNFATLARSLGLETILEVHGCTELSHLNNKISILGVNNRNLTDFTVSLDISLSLSEFISDRILAISESGIHDPADVHLLKQAGYKGFLIGEQFMSAGDPASACQTFISQLIQFEL